MNEKAVSRVLVSALVWMGTEELKKLGKYPSDPAAAALVDIGIHITAQALATYLLEE